MICKPECVRGTSQQSPHQPQAGPPQQQVPQQQQPRPVTATAPQQMGGISPAPSKPGTPGAKPEAQCDWKEFTAPDGRKYYHNRKTKESKWHMPDELRDFQAAKAAAAASVQVGISSHVQSSCFRSQSMLSMLERGGQGGCCQCPQFGAAYLDVEWGCEGGRQAG